MFLILGSFSVSVFSDAAEAVARLVPEAVRRNSSNRSSSLPGSRRLAEVASPQIRRPVALSQLQIANDRFDAEPFIGRQFLPRHLQTHAPLSGRCLDEERRIAPGRPAQDHAGFARAVADKRLGQLAGPQRTAFVYLVWILAGKRASADRHARPVMIDNELPSRKPVVPLGAADRKLSCPIEEKFVRDEARSRAS
jgi:hypothetical protein